MACPDLVLSLLVIKKNQDVWFGESDLRHERIDLCRLRHPSFDQGQPFAHSNDGNCQFLLFSVATKSLEEKLVLAVGSIRRWNQDITLGFDMDSIKT